VAVLNGILLVNEFNRLKKEGWTDVQRVVIHATKSKLRAVLMTALVPSLGFIPMAVSTGAGGEVQKPLATVVIGGLMISTLLTLFLLPILYIAFEKGFGYFRQKRKVALVSFILLLGPAASFAQQKITLHEAIEKALKNNLNIQASKLEEAYYEALKPSSLDIEKTNVGFEYGNINSFANDTRLGLSQKLQFPTVYKHQRQINETNLRISQFTTRGREVELKAQVKQVFYDLLIIEQKRSLLRTADSIYNNFLKKTEQRFKAGDVDILEKSTAENQRVQIANQLNLLQTDQVIFLNRLKRLLNADGPVVPSADTALYQLQVLPDTSQVEQSPAIAIQKQGVQLSQEQHELEKSKLLPSFNLAFNNMSIIGWQKVNNTDEKFFGAGKRFSTVGAGIEVPLFGRAQRARIKASNVLISHQQRHLQAVRNELTTELENAILGYLRNKQLLQSYQTTMLPNAANIIRTAGNRLASGETGYLDWVILINQALQIRSEYFNVMQQLNEAAFQIEKISGIN
jgi:cobalt-zinc-cadmium resistance protein CzcA